MTQYNSYALSLELKRLACRQTGNTPQAELNIEQVWGKAASSYDQFFMASQQQQQPAAIKRIRLRLELIELFTAQGVWPETARSIVDECLIGTPSLEVV